MGRFRGLLSLHCAWAQGNSNIVFAVFPALPQFILRETSRLLQDDNQLCHELENRHSLHHPRSGDAPSNWRNYSRSELLFWLGDSLYVCRQLPSLPGTGSLPPHSLRRNSSADARSGGWGSQRLSQCAEDQSWRDQEIQSKAV